MASFTSIGERYFRSLRHRNYALWAAGALVSNIGTWMQRTAQDWFVLTELSAHSPMAVGITSALQFGPQLLLLPWTGYAADRCDRRILLIVTQGAMGALAIVLGVMTILGATKLWQLDCFAFLFGCASAFDAPVRQSFVSDLVGRDDLPNAIALNSISFNAGRMLGPVAAGVCVAGFGSGWAFLLNGISFIAVLISLISVRSIDLYSGARASKAGLTEGFVYVWNHRDLRIIALMLLIIGTFGMNFPIYISTMAVNVFHVGAGRYGLLNSFIAIGTISGAVLAAGRDKVTMNVLLAGALFFGAGCFAAGIAPSYIIFAVTLGILGIAVMTFTNASNSLMQLNSAPEMRGRVMAIRLAVALGGTPIGAPIAGWVAEHLSPRWSLMLGAASGFSAAALLIAMKACERSKKGYELTSTIGPSTDSK